MEKKITRLAFIVVLCSLQLIVGIPPYMEEGSYWMRALTYSFFHASFLHLIINCIAVWTIFDPRRGGRLLQLVTAYLIAVMVYPLSLRPVIGFSNVLYAILGLRAPSLSSPWWKQPAVILFLIVTLAMVFVPSLSATTHIAAFLCGMACAAVRRCYLNLTKDARRYY